MAPGDLITRLGEGGEDVFSWTRLLFSMFFCSGDVVTDDDGDPEDGDDDADEEDDVDDDGDNDDADDDGGFMGLATVANI